MYAIGWHPPMGEQGAIIGTYAPQRKAEAVDRYEAVVPELHKVAAYYSMMFHTIHPGGHLHMLKVAKDARLPSFSDTMIVDGDDHGPFANSMTFTYDNFCNFQHLDADEIAIAAGQWSMGQFDKINKRWFIDEKLKHDAVKGGEFLVGEWQVAVNFPWQVNQCADCIVDICWCGKVNNHGTMLSTSDNNVSRFGTSIQITRQGVQAIKRFWDEGGDVIDGTIDHGERILRARLGLEEQGASKKVKR
ncbi:hypothetical protein C8J56DRAFT_860622 [Mycena floridula]|nr:hypothetical protein C8J56DRAFT_860622 [Mycena floridula]